MVRRIGRTLAAGFMAVMVFFCTGCFFLAGYRGDGYVFGPSDPVSVEAILGTWKAEQETITFYADGTYSATQWPLRMICGSPSPLPARPPTPAKDKRIDFSGTWSLAGYNSVMQDPDFYCTEVSTEYDTFNQISYGVGGDGEAVLRFYPQGMDEGKPYVDFVKTDDGDHGG